MLAGRLETVGSCIGGMQHGSAARKRLLAFALCPESFSSMVASMARPKLADAVATTSLTNVSARAHAGGSGRAEHQRRVTTGAQPRSKTLRSLKSPSSSQRVAHSPLLVSSPCAAPSDARFIASAQACTSAAIAATCTTLAAPMSYARGCA